MAGVLAAIVAIVFCVVDLPLRERESLGCDGKFGDGGVSLVRCVCSDLMTTTSNLETKTDPSKISTKRVFAMDGPVVFFVQSYLCKVRGSRA